MFMIIKLLGVLQSLVLMALRAFSLRDGTYKVRGLGLRLKARRLGLGTP